MGSWKQALREGMISGSVASALSTLMLLAAGHRREREPAAPVNAISHWLWGDPALRKNGTNVRHTLTGYLIHHAASTFWATLHARAWSQRPEARHIGPALAAAAVTASVACFVDFRLTPKRLTPGFEHRLPKPGIATVYTLFAVGLAAGSWWVANARAKKQRWQAAPVISSPAQPLRAKAARHRASAGPHPPARPC